MELDLNHPRPLIKKENQQTNHKRQTTRIIKEGKPSVKDRDNDSEKAVLSNQRLYILLFNKND